MVEVFKTNVKETTAARYIVEMLSHVLPGARINFDLLDADNILRIEAHRVDGREIARLVTECGHQCEVLE